MSLTEICGNFQVMHSIRTKRLPPHMPVRDGPIVNYQSRLHTNSEELMVEIRIEQNPQEPVIPDGRIIYLYGQFHLSDTHEMQIEAIHIFPYPASVTAEILKMFPARIEVVGYVFQESQVLPDSTKVIFVNAIAYVRDQFHVQSFIGAIVGNDGWPIPPPTPQLYSPIRIKGYLDCIDLFSLVPVITVEHLTLEVGNLRVAEIINHVQIDLSVARTFNGRPGVKDLRESLITIDPDFSWKYAESTASKASIPPYHTAYPKPVGFPTSQLSYSAPRYPAPFTEKAPIVDKIPTDNTDVKDEGVKASSETYSPDPICKQQTFPFPLSQSHMRSSSPHSKIEEDDTEEGM
ncbi:hypothetical protein M422DRAFT_269682 [Sphaerobolus stellatus SS14]|uniref:Unplaced genomic scaffold SPHSTscaffold_218, whole genome shotgun sequence n=1 Tax=Sphaerobolus stellatus (strain SS14) TaxID=990650 RepID=A0A0C9THM5_SPHS4|nr:hypothetical protein M422DRAFT_269682 [Sphaerobolus stellatus SS14]